MTTKLQHSINPLTRAPHNINFVNNIPILSNNIHLCCPELQICSHKVKSSMDRILELQSIESMKKTMLVQEQVFKQQVQELHRLYNLQKKMMQELEKGLKQLEEKPTLQTERPKSEFPVWHQTATQTGHTNFQIFAARDDPKELRRSCSGESSRMALKFDLQKPPEILSSPSSANYLFEEQKDLEKIDEGIDDVEVELTLSIGRCTRKLQRNQSNRVEKSDSSTKKSIKDEEYGGPSGYQENKRPHWLMQDLSLNRT